MGEYTTRREYLKGSLAGTLFVAPGSDPLASHDSPDNFETDSGTIAYPFRVDGLYVWEIAEYLLENGEARFLFFENARELGVQRVYLSWGAVSDRPDALGSLVWRIDKELSADTVLTTGRENVAGLEGIRNEWPEMKRYESAVDFHINVEDSRNAITDTTSEQEERRKVERRKRFLREYIDLLDDLDPGRSKLDITLRLPWFAPEYPEVERLAAELREHPALSNVVLMAYDDTLDGIEARVNRLLSAQDTSNALEGNQKFFVALELQNPAESTASSSISFWEEKEQLPQVVYEIRDSPPFPGQYQGIVLHDYEAVREYASSSGSRESIEFIDCTTVRITGNFETVMVYWSAYAPGIVTNQDPVGPVSGTKTVSVADIMGGDREIEEKSVIDAVEAYDGEFRGDPDLRKENPDLDRCHEQAKSS